jgi:hypothetical protein
MKRFALAFLPFVFTASLLAGSAGKAADAFTPIPAGSYQRTCHTISVRDGMLHASCLWGTAAGKEIYWEASMYMPCRHPGCRSCDIVNVRGRLKCQTLSSPPRKPKGRD